MRYCFPFKTEWIACWIKSLKFEMTKVFGEEGEGLEVGAREGSMGTEGFMFLVLFKYLNGWFLCWCKAVQIEPWDFQQAQSWCGAVGCSVSCGPCLAPVTAGSAASRLSDIFSQIMSTSRSKVCLTLMLSLALASKYSKPVYKRRNQVKTKALF